MRLSDRRALITGGSTGIGRATAELFAREGAQVMLSGRRQPELEATTRDIQKAGGRAAWVQGDVTNPEDAERMVRETVETFGGIDVLVNNAGTVARDASVTSVLLEEWERVIGVVLNGVFLVSRFALQQMVAAGHGGAVVNISSIGAMQADRGLAPYNTAKGGVNMLTKAMALDYAEYGIRVNAVCPGRIVTPLLVSRLKPGQDWEEMLGQWGRSIPLGRLGRPEDVAGAVVFLASSEASWITGTTLVVDGGATCGLPRSD